MHSNCLKCVVLILLSILQISGANFVPVIALKESSGLSPIISSIDCGRLPVCNGSLPYNQLLTNYVACCGSTESVKGTVTMVRLTLLNTQGHVLWGAVFNTEDYGDRILDVKNLIITSDNRKPVLVEESTSSNMVFSFYGDIRKNLTMFAVVIYPELYTYYLLSRNLNGNILPNISQTGLEDFTYHSEIGHFTTQLNLHDNYIEILPLDVHTSELPVLIGTIKLVFVSGGTDIINCNTFWTLFYNTEKCGNNYTSMFKTNYSMDVLADCTSKTDIIIDIGAVSSSCMKLYPAMNSDIKTTTLLNVSVWSAKGLVNFIRGSQLIIENYYSPEKVVAVSTPLFSEALTLSTQETVTLKASEETSTDNVTETPAFNTDTPTTVPTNTPEPDGTTIKSKQTTAMPSLLQNLLITATTNGLETTPPSLEGSDTAPFLTGFDTTRFLTGSGTISSLAGSDTTLSLAGSNATPALAGSDTTPFLTGSGTISSLAGSYTTLSLAESNATPSLAGSDTTPFLTGSGTISSLAGSDATPSLAVFDTTPFQAGSDTTPSLAGSNATTSLAGSDTTPFLTGSGTISSLAGSDATPALAGSDTTPFLTGSGTISSLAGSDATPALAGSDTKPFLTGSGTISSLAGSYATPSLEGSKATLSLAGSDATPSLAGSDAKPSLAGSDATPSLAGSDATPSLAESDTKLSLAGSNTTPSFAGSDTTPSLAGSDTTPFLTGSGTISSLAGSDATPALAGSDTTPFLTGSGTISLLAGSYATPSLEGSKATLSLAGSDATPSLAGSDAKPSLAGSDATPSLAGSDATPSLAESDTKLSLAGSNTTPSFAGSDTTPSLAGSDTTPSLAGPDTKPSPTGSDTTPFLAESKIMFSLTTELSIFSDTTGTLPALILNDIMAPSQGSKNADLENSVPNLTYYQTSTSTIRLASAPLNQSYRPLMKICAADCSSHCHTTHRKMDHEKFIKAKIKRIVTHLVVDKQTLSSTTRKRTSATDARTSSQTIGAIGIGLLVSVGLFILVLDIPNFIDMLMTI